MYYGIVFTPWIQTVDENGNISRQMEVGIDYPPGSEEVLDPYPDTSGTAQSATASTIELGLVSLIDDTWYNGMVLDIVGGTGSGQRKTILDYTNNICTVDGTWTTIPDNTSQYEIRKQYTLHGYYANNTELSNTAWGQLLGSVTFTAAYFQVANANYPPLFSDSKYCVIASTQIESQLPEEIAKGTSGQEINKLRTWLLAQGLTNQDINQIETSSTTRKDFMDAITNYLNMVAES